MRTLVAGFLVIGRVALVVTAFGAVALAGRVWAQPAILSGTIRYTGTRGVVSPSSPIRLLLFRSIGADESPIAQAVVTSNGGEYQIEAPNAGTYYLVYFFDINDDGEPLGEPSQIYNDRFNEPGDSIAVPQTGVTLDFDDTLIFEANQREYLLDIKGIANGGGFVVFGIYSNNIAETAERIYERFSVNNGGGGSMFVLPGAGVTSPLKYLTPKLGQTWSDTDDSNGYEIDDRATVVAVNDTVTVAAGTFMGCVKVEEVLTYPFGYTPGQVYSTLYRRWFAPGVGPVKLQIVNSDGTQEDGELTGYSTPGAAASDYFPLAANYSWVFTMVATGSSVDVRVVSATGSGDCNGNGAVDIGEIITMVNIALGNANISMCMAGDDNGDGQITIDEILTAVNNALNGRAGVNITGTWDCSSQQVGSATASTFVLTLVQNGSRVTGTEALGSEGSTHRVTGIVVGFSLGIGGSSDVLYWTATGSVSADGNSMAANWTDMDGASGTASCLKGIVSARPF